MGGPSTDAPARSQATSSGLPVGHSSEDKPCSALTMKSWAEALCHLPDVKLLEQGHPYASATLDVLLPMLRNIIDQTLMQQNRVHCDEVKQVTSN